MGEKGLLTRAHTRSPVRMPALPPTPLTSGRVAVTWQTAGRTSPFLRAPRWHLGRASAPFGHRVRPSRPLQTELFEGRGCVPIRSG